MTNALIGTALLVATLAWVTLGIYASAVLAPKISTLLMTFSILATVGGGILGSVASIVVWVWRDLKAYDKWNERDRLNDTLDNKYLVIQKNADVELAERQKEND